jgi:hypothetical protein
MVLIRDRFQQGIFIFFVQVVTEEVDHEQANIVLLPYQLVDLADFFHQCCVIDLPTFGV